VIKGKWEGGDRGWGVRKGKKYYYIE